MVSTKENSSGKFTDKTRIIVAIMHIERYYASVREEISPLSDDALTRLDGQYYIGFFKSRGQNYIQSIRHAQELTVIFKFTSTSAEVAASYSSSLQVSTPDTLFSTRGSASIGVITTSKYSTVANCMEITSLGFGL